MIIKHTHYFEIPTNLSAINKIKQLDIAVVLNTVALCDLETKQTNNVR